MPWLLDHCFYRQRDGWPDLRDRFPVAPMTAMVELLRDEAARVSGGPWSPSGRCAACMRWLAAEPATEVELRTAPVSGEPDQLKVTLDGHARAVAVLADTWPDPPTGDGLAPLADAAPSVRTGRRPMRTRNG